MMNVPNTITIIRILMTPFFLVSLVIDFPHHYLIALIIFIIASLSDMVDGNIARRYNQITDFGKFLDPIADKMLTTAAFLGFMMADDEKYFASGILWITFIVLTREFIVTSVRLIAAGKGNVIAANIWGKVKTVSQMIAIIATMFAEYILNAGYLTSWANQIRIGCTALLWISAVLTVISGATYVFEAQKYFKIMK